MRAVNESVQTRTFVKYLTARLATGTDTPSPLGGSSVTPEGPVPKEAWVNSEEP